MNGNKTAWRGRIFLVLFGFLSALILGEVFSRFLPPTNVGSRAIAERVATSMARLLDENN